MNLKTVDLLTNNQKKKIRILEWRSECGFVFCLIAKAGVVLKRIKQRIFCFDVSLRSRQWQNQTTTLRRGQELPLAAWRTIADSYSA